MKEFLGYEIEVPFGPAAGVLNGANEEFLNQQIYEVIKSTVGVVIPGSFTWNGGIGNESDYGVVYYHNTITGQTCNSMGLPNISSKRAQALYPEWKKLGDHHGKPVIPSVSPGKGEDPTQVLPDMVEGFAEVGAPAVEVNYSCPNKIIEGGDREPILGYDPEQMEEIDLEIVQRVGDAVTVIRKLPPYVGDKRSLIPEVAEMFSLAEGAVMVDVSNTVGGQQILTERGDPALKVPGNLGGMSGPATRQIGREQLKLFKDLLPRRVGMISCLGVDSGAEVFHRVDELGADIACGVTTYIQNESVGKSYGQTGVAIAEEYAEAMEAAA
jgi:dihydroorotate dehydrogenase